MTHQLTLYHYWRSSCSWRVRWALALKGLNYESVPVNILTKEMLSPAHLARNPAGYLPVLAVDGRHFAESLAICEWLDEAYPEPPLLPRAPLERLAVRPLALTIASGTQPLQNPSAVAYYVPDEAQRAPHVKHWIERGLGVYEQLLQRGKPGQFSHGDQVTLADLCLVPQVYNAKRFGVDPGARFPLLAGIYERCLATKACDLAAPHKQPGAS
jgi:maleylacetoacetate isomerase